MQLIVVYGPTVSEKRIFGAVLTKLGKAFHHPWLIMGDFNSCVPQSKKEGGRLFASTSRGFVGILDNNVLIELGFKGILLLQQ